MIINAIVYYNEPNGITLHKIKQYIYSKFKNDIIDNLETDIEINNELINGLNKGLLVQNKKDFQDLISLSEDYKLDYYFKDYLDNIQKEIDVMYIETGIPKQLILKHLISKEYNKL